VGPGDVAPCGLERLSGLDVVVVLVACIVSFHAAKDAFGLLSGCEFDNVCNKEMAGDKSVENGA